MTASEFKAWFDGFCEAVADVPSEAQWKRIKTRVAEIDGRAITEHVYINRYVPHYYPNYYPNYYWGNGAILCNATNTQGIGAGAATMNLASANAQGDAKAGGLTPLMPLPYKDVSAFDSHAAMLSLGRAEAQQLNS